MTRRRVIRVVAALALAAGAVWIVDRFGETDRILGGPLACPDCAEERSSIPAGLNQPVSFGLLYLVNRGEKPAVVQRVQALNRTEGLVVRALVGRPRPIGLLHGAPKHDPDNPLGSVTGFVVPPNGTDETAHQIVLVLRMTRYGQAWFRHVAVDYRVGDAEYRAVFPESVSLCTSRRAQLTRCGLPPW